MKEDVINEAISQLMDAVTTRHLMLGVDNVVIGDIHRDIRTFLEERRNRFFSIYDDRRLQLGFDVYVSRVSGTIRIDFDNREDVAWLILHTQVPFEAVYLPDPYRGNMEIDL